MTGFDRVFYGQPQRVLSNVSKKVNFDNLLPSTVPSADEFTLFLVDPIPLSHWCHNRTIALMSEIFPHGRLLGVTLSALFVSFSLAVYLNSYNIRHSCVILRLNLHFSAGPHMTGCFVFNSTLSWNRVDVYSYNQHLGNAPF